MMQVHSQHLLEMRALPPPAAQQALGLGQPPAGRERETNREIGHAVGQHARRVGRHHATPGARGQIDVVVTHTRTAHRLMARAARQKRIVDAVTRHDDGGIDAGQFAHQLVAGIRSVGLVGSDFEVLRQILQGFVEHFACDEHLLLHLRFSGDPFAAPQPGYSAPGTAHPAPGRENPLPESRC